MAIGQGFAIASWEPCLLPHLRLSEHAHPIRDPTPKRPEAIMLLANRQNSLQNLLFTRLGCFHAWTNS